MSLYLCRGDRHELLTGDQYSAEYYKGASMNHKRITRSGPISAVTLLVMALSQPAAAQGEELEEIVVRGYKSSIDSAQAIKRDADTVVDAITSIEIGQFADDSIAGAIARIPGVQIEFNDDGTAGDRASIRGMGPQFVNTTINGRVLLSAGTEGSNLRSANLDVFPPNVLGGVQVAKAQTASRPESGIAGQVDLQTLRPLDIPQLRDDNLFGSVSLQMERQDVSDDSGYRGNAIIGGRNDDSTIGGYIAIVEGSADTARDQARVNSRLRSINIDDDGDGVADRTLTDVRNPTAATYNPIREDRGRSAVAAALQFQPDDEINVVLDVAYSKFDLASTRQRGQISLNNAFGGVFAADSIDIDSNNVIQRADFSGLTGGGAIVPSSAALIYNNKTENTVGGVNIDWVASDRLGVNFDLYYSDVAYDQLLVQSINRRLLAAANGRADVIYDTSSGSPLITLGPEYLDASGYTYLRSAVRQIGVEADNVGTTLAFNLDLGDGKFPALQFGVHYDVSNVDKKFSNNVFFTPQQAGLNPADVAAASLSTEPFGDTFLSEGNVAPDRWLTVDYAAIVELDPRILTRGFGDDGLGTDIRASYQTEESNLSFFAELDIDSEVGGKDLSGNFGIRAVNVGIDSDAFAYGAVGDPVPVRVSEDYWEYLPSMNLRLQATDSVAIRFAAAKTLTRPEFEEQAPIVNVISLPDDPAPGDNGRATLGNAALNPITSTNVDLTLEYYTEQGGSVIFSLFHKDVSDFIISQQVDDTTIPGVAGTFNTTQPVNYSDGTISGAEIGFYMPFDNGFGLQANYTYVDSKFDKDVGDAGFGFPGASQDNYNVIGFWENDRFSARAAYVYRGDFFRSLAGAGAQTPDAIFTEGQGRVDLNLRVRVLENLTLAFNGTNLTNELSRDFIGNKSTFLNLFERGRTYSLAATYEF